MPRASIERKPIRSTTLSVSLVISTPYSLGFSGRPERQICRKGKLDASRPSVWNVLLSPVSGMRMLTFC